MKTKISIDLDRHKLLAGLDPDSCHPPLPRARSVVAEAEHDLAARRADLTKLENLVAYMPVRVQRGEVRADALAAALRNRDAAALVVAPAEVAVSKAKERVAAEEKAATAAVEREFVRRVEQLERVVAELAPVLDEISQLAAALASTKGMGAQLLLDWPSSPLSQAERRQGLMSSGPTTPSLMWSTK